MARKATRPEPAAGRRRPRSCACRPRRPEVEALTVVLDNIEQLHNYSLTPLRGSHASRTRSTSTLPAERRQRPSGHRLTQHFDRAVRRPDHRSRPVESNRYHRSRDRTVRQGAAGIPAGESALRHRLSSKPLSVGACCRPARMRRAASLSTLESRALARDLRMRHSDVMPPLTLDDSATSEPSRPGIGRPPENGPRR